MANPIKASDLIQDNGAIDALIAKIGQIETALEEVNKTSKRLQKENASLGVGSSAERQAIQQTANEITKLEREQKKLNEVYSDTGKQIAELQAERRKAQKIQRLEITIANAATGSQEQLRAQYQKNIIELSKYNAEQIKSSKSLRQLVKDTKDIKEEIDDFKESVGTKPLGRLLQDLEAVPGATGQATRGITGLRESFNLLIKNPIVAVLAVIVGTLTALFNAFRQSERGADLFARASGAVSGALDAIIPIAEKVVDALTFVFSEPKEAANSLWETIKENFINRFQAVPLVFNNAKDVIIGVFKAIGLQAKLAFADVPIIGSGIDKAQVQSNLEDLQKQVREGLSGLGSGVVQFTTGLDREDQKQALEGFKNIKDSIVESSNAQGGLNVKQRDFQRQSAALRKEIAELNKEQTLQQQIAGDSTISFERQREANQRALDLAVERGEKEIQLSRLQLGLINRELELRRRNGKDTVDLLERQASAFEAVQNAELEFLSNVEDANRNSRQITQDELERDLDFLLDVFDARKTANERLLKDESIAFEERRKILNDTARLGEDSFNRQIAIIEQFAGTTIDANEFINESDAEVVRQKARALGLSEIIEGRLIEIIRDRVTANQDLAESEKELNAAQEKFNQEQIQNRINFLIKERDEKIKAFEQEQELQQSEFELIKATEEQREAFELGQQKKLLEQKLQANKEFNEAVLNDAQIQAKEQLLLTEGLTDTQIETIKNQIEKLRQDIAAVGESTNLPNNLLDLLGLKFDSEQQTILQNTASQVIGFLNQMTQARIQAADRAVSESQRELDAARRTFEEEERLARQGGNARVEAARQELQEQERLNRQALREQERAQKQQAVIDTLSQSSNLLVGASRILSKFNPLVAIPIIALMFGTFAKARIDAFKSARREFSDGGYRDLKGGSHASGNDIYLGQSASGTSDYAEGGEGQAIFSRRTVKKYGSNFLERITNSLNAGTFDDLVGRDERVSDGVRMMSFASASNTDVSGVESRLDTMIRQRGDFDNRDANGKGTVRRGNMTIHYV